MAMIYEDEYFIQMINKMSAEQIFQYIEIGLIDRDQLKRIMELEIEKIHADILRQLEKAGILETMREYKAKQEARHEPITD
jgi:hypothetical protein